MSILVNGIPKDPSMMLVSSKRRTWLPYDDMPPPEIVPTLKSGGGTNSKCPTWESNFREQEEYAREELRRS